MYMLRTQDVALQSAFNLPKQQGISASYVQFTVQAMLSNGQSVCCLKMAVLWDVPLCSVVLNDVSRSLLHRQVDVVGSSETSVGICSTHAHNTWCHVTEDSRLHICRRENLRYHLVCCSFALLVCFRHPRLQFPRSVGLGPQLPCGGRRQSRRCVWTTGPFPIKLGIVCRNSVLWDVLSSYLSVTPNLQEAQAEVYRIYRKRFI
jgi:hypothetical protein